MPHIPAKTPHQLNVRWAANDIWEIRRISEQEDQRQSDVVRFLLRWAINQYHTIGSFHQMRMVLYNNLSAEKLIAEAELDLARESQKKLEEETHDRPAEKAATKRSAR